MKTCLIIMSCVLLVCCAKPEEDDLSGDLNLEGIVYLNDTLRSFTGESSLKNATIQLRYADGSSDQNFLRSSTTDTLGNFLFTNLFDRAYRIQVAVQSNGFSFLADTAINPRHIQKPLKLVLYPVSPTYNTLVIVARDSATRGFLTGVPVCFFGSRLVAAANVCTGSFLTLTTDDYGRAYATGLPVGKYYLNAEYSAGSVTISRKDSVEILQNRGFARLEVSLK